MMIDVEPKQPNSDQSQQVHVRQLTNQGSKQKHDLHVTSEKSVKMCNIFFGCGPSFQPNRV